MRNDVAEMLQELLKIIPELHEQGRLGAAAVQMKYPRSWQVVHSADQPENQCHSALPDHHRRSVHVDVCVCAGGCACSKIFVDATFFAFGRPPLACRLPQCTGAARARPSGFVGSAPIRLTVPHTPESWLFGRQRPYDRTSSRKLERLRRAAPSCVLSALLVSLAVLSARAHAERRREHPRSGSLARCSGTDFAELPGSPQSFPEDKRHCFEVYRPCSYFLSQEIIFLRQHPEIFTPLLTESVPA